MKKFLAAAAAAIIFLGAAACSGNSTQSAAESRTESGSEVYSCGMSVPFGEDWSVYTGSSVYQQLLEDGGESGSADDLRKSYEDNGTACLLYAVNSDKSAVMSLTTVEITTDETTGERLTAEDYARNNHDTAVFTYQASGFTVRNSSFGEEEIGGKSGYLSHYELCTDEEASVLLLGQTEFIFELDGKLCSLQAYYHTEEAAQQAGDIIAAVTAK